MKSILIIGAGEFGKHLAYKLVKLGSEVCIIDSNPDLINVLSNDFDNTYVGDCMQLVTLKELRVNTFDMCIVSIGSNFQASLEITANLKELKAKYIISKAHSDIQSKFLLMAGANEIIYPEKDLAEKLAVKCNANNLADYISISDKYSIFEIKVLKAWIGKSIRTLDIRNKYDINIIAVRSKGKVIVPTADYEFEDDDIIIIFGRDSLIKKLK